MTAFREGDIEYLSAHMPVDNAMRFARDIMEAVEKVKAAKSDAPAG
jgi:hypothetical protein